MKTIDKATIRQYQKDKRSLWVWFALPGLPMFVGAAVCGLADQKRISDTWWPWGVLALVIGTIVLLSWGNNMVHDKACQQREESWQYKLLDRWAEWSDQPLSIFPMSNIGSKYLERWAIEELTSRAQLLSEHYSLEENFYKEEKKIDWENLNPRVGEKIKELRTHRETFMKADVKFAKDSFLNLWDLVTEKDGIGILTGSEWQDPEVFRRKVFAEGRPYIRIGFVAY